MQTPIKSEAEPDLEHLLREAEAFVTVVYERLLHGSPGDREEWQRVLTFAKLAHAQTVDAKAAYQREISSRRLLGLAAFATGLAWSVIPPQYLGKSREREVLFA